MIDFTRAKLTDKDRIEKKLISDKVKYEVEGKYNLTLGKKPYPIRSKRENMFINVTEKGAYIENSIHKYFNNLVSDENQNYNDFYFSDLLYALNVLEDEIDYPLEDTLATNLEFGFNINLDMCPTRFLNNHLLMHKLKSPCYDPKNDKNMKLKKFTYTEYEIKAYNKTLDHSRFKEFREHLKGTNILRIEIKYKSKNQLHKLGIDNLADLKNPKNLYLLMNDFLKKFDDLIIIDSYDGNALMSKKDRRFITLCTHPNYWLDLKENSHPNTPNNHKIRFKELMQKYELNTWKNSLKKDILSKFNQLMVLDCYDSTNNLLNVA